MKTFLLFPLLFLPLLTLGQTEPEPLYINGVRLDSVPARYAVVRMYRVTTGKDFGSFRVLFDYGQLQETGALRTRYENADELSDKYLSTKDGLTYQSRQPGRRPQPALCKWLEAAAIRAHRNCR